MNIVFATLRNTFDKNPVAREMPLEQFVEYVCDTSKRLSVDPSWTKEEYDAAKIKQKAIAPVGGRRKNAILEDSVVKFDFDHLNRTQYRDLTRKFKNATFFNILHTTASHQHACKNGDYAFRVLVPARTPFNSNDAWMVQRAICAELEIDESLRDHCTEDGNRLIYLPHKESKITVTEGRVIRAERYIKKAEEMGLRKREAKTLAADEHGLNADIAHFCEAELGLDALSSGRGYEVPCPNEHLHTGKGSTSIMLDGKEVRFVCQHTNNGACTELNRRQHLALRMCGLPDELNVDKQPISINSIRAALPDLPDEEIEELHRTENEEPVTCTLEDLEDEPEVEKEPAYSVVDGLMQTNESFYICAKSHTGKSTFSMAIDAAIAAEKRYAFGGAEVAEGHAFIFAGEGAQSFERHKKSLQIALGDSLDRLHIIDCVADGCNLLDEAWRRQAVRMMRRVAGEEKIVKVTFDTLQTCIPGFDENDNRSMKEAAQALNEIAATLNAAVGAMVHPTKNIDETVPSENGMMPKGGSDFHNSIDNGMFLHKPDNDNNLEINLYHIKNRNGERQKARGFVIQKIKIAEPPEKKEPTHNFMGLPEGYSSDDVCDFDAGNPHIDVFVNFNAFSVFVKKVEGMTDEQKEAVKEKVGQFEKLDSKEATVIYALGKLQGQGDDKRGFSMSAIVKAAKEDSYGVPINANNDLRKKLEEMHEAGVIVSGLDNNNRPIPKQYRLPWGINDNKIPKTICEPNEMLTVTEEDLE